MTKYMRFSALLVILLLITGCSVMNASEVTFRPISDIVSQPLEVTNFANDGSASLPIHTDTPVACTVVYGKTPEFGAVSLDQDMDGGTHSDHNPVLSGLEPETTYYYRVQGVDSAGVIYISEVMTFTTPARTIVEVDNLASPGLGAEIIGYSSAFGDAAPSATWGVESAFDGSPNTAWSSKGDGSQAWVEVRLAKPAKITAVSFHSRAMSDGSAITHAFTVTTDSGEVFGPFSLPDADEPYEFEVSVEAQTLRFDLVETTGGNTGAVEITVFGEFLE